MYSLSAAARRGWLPPLLKQAAELLAACGCELPSVCRPGGRSGRTRERGGFEDSGGDGWMSVEMLFPLHSFTSQSSGLIRVQRRSRKIFLVQKHFQGSEEHTSELQSLRHLVCR